jgi:hypothetical protein
LRARHLALPLAGLAGVLLVVRGFWIDRPTDGAYRNFRNLSGELTTTLLLITAEIAIMYAILRPWSYYRAWRRASIATFAFVPWTFGYFVAGQHAGSMNASHWAWLSLVTIGLVALTAASAGAAMNLRHPVLLAALIAGMLIFAIANWWADTSAPAWLSWGFTACGTLAATILVDELLSRQRWRRHEAAAPQKDHDA